MKLLYITRKFPPMVGGMENMSYALAKEFPKFADTTLITWGKSQKYLPYIYILFFFKSIWILSTKKIEHIHIGDGLLSPLGLFLKTVFKVKTTISIVGLDVTFNFPGYQFLIPKCTSRLDKVICISDATLEECVKRGIPKSKCIVIPCGVYPNEYRVNASRADLEKIVGRKLQNKKIVVTVGRLVERKGVYWFIENVFSKLPKNTVYIVVGEGPEKERIRKLIQREELQDQILLLGKVNNETVKTIYNTCDMFVMPNIKVDATMEGFGLVAIEASAAGLPVIASDLEGIKNAVIDGKNGYLVKSGDADEFIETINKVIVKSHTKKTIMEYTKKYFLWTTIVKEYITEFKKIHER